MAQTADGTIIDPAGGRAHLEARLLHHVSDAFREDPVRILRVARFAARLHELGFRVAPATVELMRAMVEAGEAAALVPERVWQETASALAEPRPDIYVRVLRDCGALAVVFPEVDALYGVPQPAAWHPEIDTGVHVELALRQAARLSFSTEVRFAVLVHDLGKGTTPPSEWPRHVGHEQRSADLVRALSERLAVPNRCRDLGVAVALNHGLCHRALELRPVTLLKLLDSLDAFRRPERVTGFLDACEADARGRTGLADQPYPQRDLVLAAWRAALAVDARAVAGPGGAGDGLSGEQIGEAIRNARLAAVAAAREGFRPG
jgi:tRNA nucleotidyltransferase (CCA-adding enzyme)